MADCKVWLFYPDIQCENDSRRSVEPLFLPDADQGVFKTAREYLQLLPLSKWTDTTVRGKILHDIINEIVFLELRRSMETSGISMNRLFGKTQSLMCFKNSDNRAVAEVPNKTVKQFYKLLGIEVPSQVDIQKHSKLLLNHKNEAKMEFYFFVI